MSLVLPAVFQRTLLLNKYDGDGELARTVCPSSYDSGGMRIIIIIILYNMGDNNNNMGDNNII